MNFETLLLRGLFGTCALVCGLTLLAMVTATPASALATPGHAIATTQVIAAVNPSAKAG